MARKSTGTRLRFKVFQRDSFTCQYCGSKPGQEDVVLQVDHIVPVSKGGTDDIENLLTACRRCNAGKSNRSLSDVTPRITKNTEEIQEKYEQLLEFFKFQKKSEKLKQDILEDLVRYWFELYEVELDPRQKVSLKSFTKNHTNEEIKEAMEISMRMRNAHYAFKYMCGVLHNKRKKKEEYEQYINDVVDMDAWEKFKGIKHHSEITQEEWDELRREAIRRDPVLPELPTITDEDVEDISKIFGK